MSTWFDFEAFSRDTMPADTPFDLQPLSMFSEVGAGFFESTPTPSADPTAVIPIEHRCVSPSVFLQPLDDWFASQIEDNNAIDIFVHSASPSTDDSSPPSSQEVISSITRPLKRKADDTDYEDDASSCCSEYIPSHRPAKRPATSRRTAKAPLPAHLHPVKVQSATLPRCPMPGCGVALEDKDSAWRGHFKKVHHNELCITPGCNGPSGSTCKAKCPFPIPGCKSCAPASRDDGEGKKGAGGAMTIESVGRHLLNIHFKVAYRCPLCGLQNHWRESACVRHIRRCMDKKEYSTKQQSFD